MSMVTLLKTELNLLGLALGFFTRLPLPQNLNYSPELLNHSTRYYGVVGGLIGLLLIPIFWATHTLFPLPLAVLLTITASLIITGAFHEDGLADMTDGFGGGYTPERKLEIMKDSRQGTFGVCAIVLTLSFYYVALATFSNLSFMALSVALLSGHSLSRIMAGTLVADLPYLRTLDSRAKAKPLSTGLRRRDLVWLLLSAIPFLALLSWPCALGLIPLLVVIHMLYRQYLLSQFGGYTGDCLGGAQVITMISIWLYQIMWLKLDLTIIAPWLSQLF